MTFFTDGMKEKMNNYIYKFMAKMTFRNKLNRLPNVNRFKRQG